MLLSGTADKDDCFVIFVFTVQNMNVDTNNHSSELKVEDRYELRHECVNKELRLNSSRSSGGLHSVTRDENRALSLGHDRHRERDRELWCYGDSCIMQDCPAIPYPTNSFSLPLPVVCIDIVLV